jgi:hypothetical protein
VHLTLQKLKTASLTFQISRGYLIQQKLKRALHITKSQGHLTLQKLKMVPHNTKGLLTDWDEISHLYRGPSKDASY